jgi:hypothetical protein
MAKNLGREFATMSEDERRRFALEPAGTDGETETAADELELGDPRQDDHLGRQYGSLQAEIADPDARDGQAALLDDEAHQRGEQPPRHRDHQKKGQR